MKRSAVALALLGVLGVALASATYRAQPVAGITGPQGVIETFAGGGGEFSDLKSSAVAPNGDVYVLGGCTISRVQAGVPTTYYTFAPAVGGNTCANPRRLVFDPQGNLHAVVACTVFKFVNDSPQAVYTDPGSCFFNNFYFDLDFDYAGNMYIADYTGCAILRVTGGVATKIAGNLSLPPLMCDEDTGDGGPAVNSKITRPTAIDVDEIGNVYFIGEYGRLRKIGPSGSVSTVFAGVQNATFKQESVLADSSGDVYFTDSRDCFIGRISGGVMDVVAGLGSSNCTGAGDGGAATSASVAEPVDLSLDADGTLYLADSTTNRLRVIYGTALDSDGDGYSDHRELVLGKSAVAYCATMRADLDGDGVVTILDISTIATRYLQLIPPAPPRYNQDGDNGISILDIAVMSGLFLDSVSDCP